MAKRQKVKCANKDCKATFRADLSVYSDSKYVFCRKCRSEKGYKVLVAEKKFGNSIENILIRMLKKYRRPDLIADALQISIPTVHSWVKQFFNVTAFEEFKRQYLCVNKSCISISKDDLSAKVKSSVLNRLKADNICYCSIRSQSVLIVNMGVGGFKKILSACHLKKSSKN